MVERTLFLRWNDHHDTFIHMLPDIRQKEQFCDATILCEGHFYSVHRFVLATCSSYFKMMFSRLECKHHPMIVLTDIKAVQLEALLLYMYYGELNILQKNLSDVLRAATSLKVRGLTEDSDHEVDMEINPEDISQFNSDVPHAQGSSQRNAVSINEQHGREGNKRMMDTDSQCKTVKQTKRTDSSSESIPCNDMQQPSSCQVLRLVEPTVPCQGQNELPLSIAENDTHHEALFLWKGGLDMSTQKDTDPRQNCNINSAVSPSVESIMEEIEVKNETIEVMPLENYVYDSDTFESPQIYNPNPSDCNITTETTQQGSLQDDDDEVPNLITPSTSSMNECHNSISLAGNRVTVCSDARENCFDLYYPVKSSYLYSKTHENNAELNNTVESRSELDWESRCQSDSSADTSDCLNEEIHSDHMNSMVNSVLLKELQSAISLAGHKENRIQTPLPCANHPDTPPPVKRKRGRPRKVVKNSSHTKGEGSGTTLEIQNNSGSQSTQNAESEINCNHNIHNLKKASQTKLVRRRRNRSRSILKGYHSTKRDRRLAYTKIKQKNSSEVCRINPFPEDGQVTMNNTGIQRKCRGKSRKKDVSEERRIRSRP